MFVQSIQKNNTRYAILLKITGLNAYGAFVGTLGVICSIMWFFLVYNSPAEHPRISTEEREYIETALNAQATEKVWTLKLRVGVS